MCEGSGTDEWGGTCMCCGGNGRDPDCCEQCDQIGVGFNEDGEYLCEECMFEAATSVSSLADGRKE